MGVIEWGATPWGQSVPIHIGWWLAGAALLAGLVFLVVHALWMRFRARPGAAVEATPPELAACVPPRVLRHSLAARLFHWVMAAAMLTLLASAFLPKAGLRFPWLTLHIAAGVVLLLAICYHIVNAVFFMDFWSIWPGRADWRALGRAGRMDGKPGKYAPLNKFYHLAIVACGLTMAATGFFMLFRVRTPFFTRNPYILGDMTWGVIYLLHGFAGVALIVLVAVHIYFALRPEERPVMRAMIGGTMERDYVLAHHDPRQWGCDSQGAA